MGKIKRGIKMKVTPEQSRKVQEICFVNGIGWEYSGKHILHDIQPYLFIAVEGFLEDKDGYHKIKLDNDIIDIEDAFNWRGTKEGHIYWYSLQNNEPENLVYDMNEIVFAEVDKRITEQKSPTEFISTEEFDQMLEQKATTKYMVFVEGRRAPKVVHDSYDSAETEAKRLSAKEIDYNVSVVEIIKTYKSKVIVEEVK